MFSSFFHIFIRINSWRPNEKSSIATVLHDAHTVECRYVKYFLPMLFLSEHFCFSLAFHVSHFRQSFSFFPAKRFQFALLLLSVVFTSFFPLCGKRENLSFSFSLTREHYRNGICIFKLIALVAVDVCVLIPQAYFSSFFRSVLWYHVYMVHLCECCNRCFELMSKWIHTSVKWEKEKLEANEKKYALYESERMEKKVEENANGRNHIKEANKKNRKRKLEKKNAWKRY